MVCSQNHVFDLTKKSVHFSSLAILTNTQNPGKDLKRFSVYVFLKVIGLSLSCSPASTQILRLCNMLGVPRVLSPFLWSLGVRMDSQDSHLAGAQWAFTWGHSSWMWAAGLRTFHISLRLYMYKILNTFMLLDNN